MKHPKACIINFSTNNLLSIDRAIKHLGYETEIIDEKVDISSYELIVLPGVGAFGEVMKNIKKNKLIDVVLNSISSNKKLFSICLGMQLLFEESEEFGHTKGIGFFKGKVQNFNKFDTELNTFIGWNNVKFNDQNFNKSFLGEKSNLINSSYYFVHSCCVQNVESHHIKGTSSNGNISYPSIMMKDNVIATQFHPEKSGKNGIKLLESFLKFI